MSLPPDLVEMLSEFGAFEVRYLVVGGHAVSLHAKPRTTKDLDCEPARSNRRVGRAQNRYGVVEIKH